MFMFGEANSASVQRQFIQNYDAFLGLDAKSYANNSFFCQNNCSIFPSCAVHSLICNFSVAARLQPRSLAHRFVSIRNISLQA